MSRGPNWLSRGTGRVEAAFEVEHSTSSYSGIVRMCDFTGRGKCYSGVCESCLHLGEWCSSTPQCCSGLTCFAAGGNVCFN